MAEQEVESWDIKMFSAEDISEKIKQARKDFQEEKYNNTALVKCDQCGAYVHATAQHFNDVGGQIPGFCEMCWVSNLIWFWMNEDAGEQDA
jgi:formylmethanofuran dehydrogenase subunit E